jgi:phenylpropionate dioxygenase-like ring-hydroxylating dioxygenase large terminal subunit
MKERTGWWPVARSDAVGAQPLAVRLLDEGLVLWRQPDGAVAVLADRCPHRGARLSLGEVVNGHLQCPYHGWRFAGDGHCMAIPAQPAFQPGPVHAACRHQAQEAHGLVWVRLADAAAADGLPWPGLPDLTHLPARHLLYGPFDVATSAPRAVENFLDTSHFAFVHRGWLGDGAHPEVPPYEVTHTPDGRPVIDAYKAWQPRATAAAEGGDWVTYRYEVLSPYSALLTKQADTGGPQDSYTLWACPTTPDNCRLWFAQYTTDLDSSDESLRDFQVTIFSQDRPILESQQPSRLPISGGEAHSAADRLSAAYRRYLQACGISFGVC